MSTGSHRFTSEVDLSDVRDCRAVAVGMVPAHSRVLDVGLGSGSVVRILRDMGCRVWGVGADQESVEAACDAYEMVFEADLDSSEVSGVIGQQRFDVILMLDVLEHRRDPAGLLRLLGHMLAEQGWGVISLLNGADASLRLDLLEECDDCPDAGPPVQRQSRLLDRQGMDDLLAESGWQRFDLVGGTRDFDVSELRLAGEVAGPAGGVGSDADGQGHRFLAVAAPIGSPVLNRPPVLPAAIAQRSLSEATARVQELDRELGHLHKHVLPYLMDQLDVIRGNVSGRTDKLKDVLVAIGQLEERSRQLFERLAQLDRELREANRELRAANADVAVKDEFVVALEAELDQTLTHLRAKTRYIEALPWVRMKVRMKGLWRRPT